MKKFTNELSMFNISKIIQWCLACVVVAPIGGGEWMPPVNLSPVTERVVEIEVAMSPKGYAVATWDKFDGSHFSIRSASSYLAGPWSVPTTLSAKGFDAFQTDVEVDHFGNAVAIWALTEASDVIQSSSLRAGQKSWSMPVNVSSLSPLILDPDIAIDQVGNAYAIWHSSNGVNSVVQSAIKPFGGSWSPAIDLTTGENGTQTKVAVNAAGDAIAIWVNATNHSIESASRPIGGEWSAPIAITAIGQKVRDPQIAVDPTGNGVAVWTMTDGSNDIIMAANKPLSGAWTTPVALSAAGGDGSLPQIVVDFQGNATAVWQRSEGANTIIQSASQSFGNTWSKPENLTYTGEDASEPDLAVDYQGNIVYVWQRSDGTNSVIQTRTKPFGQAWSVPVDLSIPDGNALDPHVALDAFGNAVAVWIKQTGSDSYAQAAFRRNIVVIPPKPPIDFIGVLRTKKLRFREKYFLQTSWRASPTKDVTLYRIYKDNLVMGEVSAINKLVFKTHIPSKASAEAYSIVAVSSENVESVPVPIRIENK